MKIRRHDDFRSEKHKQILKSRCLTLPIAQTSVDKSILLL